MALQLLPNLAPLVPPARFDDRLATILGQPDGRRGTRLAKWRQAFDLLVQLAPHRPSAVLAEGYAYLAAHHHEVPAEAYAGLNRAFRGHKLPPELARFLAPPAAGPALALADAPRPAAEEPANGHARPWPGADQPARRGAAPEPPLPSPAIFFRTAAAAAPSAPVRLRRRGVDVQPLEEPRRREAKAAFTTRRVEAAEMLTLVSGAVRPRSGDLVLARVDRVLYQSRLELASGRKAALHAADEIIVAYGDRYATDQFEAEVPSDLGPTNLVATGGVAGRMLSRTAGIKAASQITPIGLIGDARGNPINLRQYALPPIAATRPRPRTVAVLGTSMNSGKTTTNRYLVAGLGRAGLRPGAVKITGTGSGGDYWVMADAGAHRVLDFTDAGYSSTYRIPLDEIEAAATILIRHLTEAGCGIILVEVADGLFHEQNAELIRSAFFRSHVDGVFFAAGEAMGAAAGVRELRAIGIPVLGVSGKLTASELLIREAERHCDAPILTKKELGDPAIAPALVGLAAGPAPASMVAERPPQPAGQKEAPVQAQGA